MPCFHCARTSSHEYKWNSTSCPEGVPRKKKGISTAKAAAAIERSGAQVRRLRRSGTLLSGGSELSARPDFPMVASFAYHRSCGESISSCCTCSHRSEEHTSELQSLR